MLGRGPVGGYMHSFEDQGTAAADIALEILAGKDPATPPRQTKPPHKYMVDANALRRWGMDEAALPPGATVLFRQPTVWDQYRAQIFAIFAIVLLQAALIAWLLFERNRRFRAAEQAGKARAETGQHREILAHLVRVHMVGEMSAAITHEVNQPLAAIKNYAFAARRRLAGHSPILRSKSCWTDRRTGFTRGRRVEFAARDGEEARSERAKTEVGPWSGTP